MEKEIIIAEIIAIIAVIIFCRLTMHVKK